MLNFSFLLPSKIRQNNVKIVLQNTTVQGEDALVVLPNRHLWKLKELLTLCLNRLQWIQRSMLRLVTDLNETLKSVSEMTHTHHYAARVAVAEAIVC